MRGNNSGAIARVVVAGLRHQRARRVDRVYAALPFKLRVANNFVVCPRGLVLVVKDADVALLVVLIII